MRDNSSSTRISILYLLYPTGPGYQRERPLRALRRIADRLPGEKTFVQIDNSASTPFEQQVSANEYSISGDNRYREFSGWQRGLDFLAERGMTGDVCLLANDTLLRQSRFHRRLVNAAAVECCRRHRAMVGRRMVLGAEGHILGNPLIPYVRTHLFLLPQAALAELGSVVSLDDASIARLLAAEFDPDTGLFRPDAPLSPAIRDYIVFHLTSAWYRKQAYSAESFTDLRGKAISILNALLLSIRVHELGFPLTSYAAAARQLRGPVAPEQWREAWMGAPQPAAAAHERDGNRFWRPGSARYRGMPEKLRAFSLESLLDVIERGAHPEHL